MDANQNKNYVITEQKMMKNGVEELWKKVKPCGFKLFLNTKL